MLAFCAHSLFRAYGWRFVWRVALPHPLRTVAAAFRACRLECTAERMEVPGTSRAHAAAADRTVLGAGFCLKPLACPAGRFNHDCDWFDRPAAKGGPPAACCAGCEIRALGEHALAAGSAFTIMTSASDILDDLYVPALREGRFTRGVFALCRYSFLPFAVGLLASGMRGLLVPFASGDCCDYGTWLRADNGTKEEQTRLTQAGRIQLLSALSPAPRDPPPPQRFRRVGNVFMSR